jgi:hypothetical protein
MFLYLCAATQALISLLGQTRVCEPPPEVRSHVTESLLQKKHFHLKEYAVTGQM